MGDSEGIWNEFIHSSDVVSVSDSGFTISDKFDLFGRYIFIRRNSRSSNAGHSSSERVPGHPKLVVGVGILQREEIILHPSIPDIGKAIEEILTDSTASYKRRRLRENFINDFVSDLQSSSRTSENTVLVFNATYFYLNESIIALSECETAVNPEQESSLARSH